MKKEFTPIAMKCSKEQFKAIKPKLKKIGQIGTLTRAFENYHYLTNNYDTKQNAFDFIDKGFTWEDDHQNNIHETWNEKVFLDACGIETEPEYVITREQVLYLRNIDTPESLLKEWFPDAFKEDIVELPKDFTGWAKSNRKGDELWMMYFENGYLQYGIDSNGNWFLPNGKPVVRCADRKATPEEVTEALTKEAIKLKYKENIKYVECLCNFHKEEAQEYYTNPTFIFYYEESVNRLWIQDSYFLDICVFHNGKWASFQPTITKEEAEQKLNCKII